MEEPSVLDWVKEKLAFWRRRSPTELDAVQTSTQELFDDEPIAPIVKIFAETTEVESRILSTEVVKPEAYKLPWKALIAIILGLAGQRMLAPETRNLGLGVVLFTAGIAFLIWGLFGKDWRLNPLPEPIKDQVGRKFRKGMFGLAILMLIVAFLMLGGNQFNFINLVLWLLAVLYSVLTFVEISSRMSFRQWISASFQRIQFPWNIKVDGFTVLFFLALLISIFFRLYHLNQVPAEMISDHAEKLLDTGDVLNGQYAIFFPRNTGREAFQLYWTALVSWLFGTGLSFTSLKIGTSLAGLFTLPFIYLLGKEMGSKWGGLAGMLFGGVAYWPNVITRIGLRFTFYAAFTAPALYFFFRGLRRSNRNDMIWAGIFLGLGLHGYSPMRIVPFLIVVIALLFLFSKQGRLIWKRIAVSVGIVAMVSAAVALPLLRFTSEYPELVALRAFSRLGDASNPIPGSGLEIFLQNFWKASTMFFWSNGEIWPHSIPYAPALDGVMAVFYLFGCVLLLARFLKARSWQDVSLLISVPFLLLPSILSLAYPAENPSLNRTSAAFVPVVLIAGLAFETFIRGILQPEKGGRGKWLAVIATGSLLAIMLSQNYQLVFNQYAKQYQLSAWNTSEIGGIIRQFADTIGDEDNAYVVGYPHWVDTRLVAYNAGFPGKDFAIWPEQFNLTLEKPGAKLFILYPLDEEGLRQISAVYPSGVASYHESNVEGKDFYVFFVPPEGVTQP